MTPFDLIDPVCEALLQRFPESRLRGAALDLITDEGRVDLVVVAVDYHPIPVLVVPTIVLDGFALHLTPTGRRIAVMSHDSSGEDLLAAMPGPLSADELAVGSNDPGFASAWLDVVTLGALARTLGVKVTPAGNVQVAHVTGCLAEVRDNFVMVRPATVAADHLAACARAAALLSTRPERLGAELAAIFERRGAIVTGARWDLGREFCAVVERGGATVRIDQVFLLPGEPAEAAHLRTRVRARRAGPPTSEALNHRLRPLARLVTAAQPGSIDDDGDEILLLWAGLIRAADRLDPAIELVARLAGAAGSTGPYR